MKPIEMVMNDVKLVLEARRPAEKFGLNPNDLVNDLRRKLHDNGVDGTSRLAKLIEPVIGQIGIYEVLHNLQLNFDQKDTPDNLMEKWFSFRGVDKPPQPHVLPNELVRELTQMAQEAVAAPATLDALMKDRLARLLRHTSLFYGRELRDNGRLAPPAEGTSHIAEMLEKLTLSELCDLLNCDVPVRAIPYDPDSTDTIVLSGGAVCAALSRLAELTGTASAWSAEQSREFSDCLLAVLKAWCGDNPHTPKACTVAESRETPYKSKLICYDEIGGTVVLKGGSSLAYGTDVLVRAADQGDIWAPEPQVVPQADVWETPDTVSRKDTRSASILRRDLVFISYSHKDADWLEKLKPYLEPFVREAKMKIWDDTQIKAGADWKQGIRQALAAAKVAVLLVSQDFLASKFITAEEVPPLLAAAENEGVTIFWIPVRKSSYMRTPIATYQAAHPPDTPLATLSDADVDGAFVDICEQILQEYER
jgi:hypothetical protein